MDSEISEDSLRQLRTAVREDLRVFRHMQAILTRRVSEVRIQRAGGALVSQLPEFAGTAAVKAALSLSVIQMEYMLASLDTQLGDTQSADVIPLAGRES